MDKDLVLSTINQDNCQEIYFCCYREHETGFTEFLLELNEKNEKKQYQFPRIPFSLDFLKNEKIKKENLTKIIFHKKKVYLFFEKEKNKNYIYGLYSEICHTQHIYGVPIDPSIAKLFFKYPLQTIIGLKEREIPVVLYVGCTNYKAKYIMQFKNPRNNGFYEYSIAKKYAEYMTHDHDIDVKNAVVRFAVFLKKCDYMFLSKDDVEFDDETWKEKYDSLYVHCNYPHFFVKKINQQIPLSWKTL